MQKNNHLDNHVNQSNKKHINANIIVESVARGLEKYGRIILISVAAIIVIITAILSYFTWVQYSDKDANNKLEQGITAYLSLANVENSEQAQLFTAIASENFREVIDSAKSETLKLRAQYELAGVLFDSRSFLEATRLYNTVSQKRSFYLAEPALYNKGIAEMEQQKYDDAITTFESFLKLYPNSYLLPEATLSLATVYYSAKNDSREAIAILKDWLVKNAETTDSYKLIFEERISLMENNIY